MRFLTVSNIITWLVFIAGSAWLVLSDLEVVPRLYVVDHYYWLILIVFILLAGRSSIKSSK